MNIWLESGIGEAIRACTAEAKVSARAALSCEVGNLTANSAKDIIASAVAEWHREAVIIFRRVGSGKGEAIRAGLIDMKALAVVIDEALESEEVVSIRDPSALGGCTFDLSPEESPKKPGAVALLVTAWGVHEAMVERLADALGEETFRQGTSIRLDR